MSRVGEALRLDSWLNGTTNVGVNHGKNALTFHAQRSDYLHDEALARLYELDGIAARIVDAVPKHAMRRPPTLRIGDAATSIAVQDTLDDLGAWGALRDAWCWARLFGGAAVVLGADDGLDPREPLTLAGLSALRFLVAVDRRDLTPQTWESDDLSARYGSPRTYLLQRHGGTTTQTAAVHRSRVIRFDGVPTTRRRRLELQGWGDSVLQRVHVELQAARGVFAGAGTLVQEASVTVVGVKDLMSLMGDDPDDILKTRFDVMQRMMSLGRWLLIDAEGERAERLEVGALTGLVDVLDRFVNFLAAVSGIPVTVLMGQAPAGLNATGESDIRSWYDEVAAEREAVLRPALERLVRAILRAKDGPTKGVEPAGWRIEFPPLWQMTPAEEVELRAKQAGIDVQYVTAQVLTPEEVAINRFRADGWSPETSIDLVARQALLDEDDAGGGTGEDDRADARGAEHAAGVAGVVARVAAREIPRTTGVELLVQAFELDAEAADRAMGESGRTWFTAPEPTHAADMDAMRADLAKAQASLRGHQVYTARLIQRAKAGGLELGAFTAREPTEVGEGDVLEPGDVVAVPVQDGRADGSERTDGKEHDVSERDREPGGQFAPEGKGGDKKPEEPKKAEEKAPAKEATPSTEGQEKQAPPAGGEGETKRPERMRGGVVGAVGKEYSQAVSDAVDGDGPRENIPPEIRKRAADFYRNQADAGLSNTWGPSAELFNRHRADYLEGLTDEVPGKLGDFCRRRGIPGPPQGRKKT